MSPDRSEVRNDVYVVGAMGFEPMTHGLKV